MRWNTAWAGPMDSNKPAASGASFGLAHLLGECVRMVASSDARPAPGLQRRGTVDRLAGLGEVLHLDARRRDAGSTKTSRHRSGGCSWRYFFPSITPLLTTNFTDTLRAPAL